MRTASNRLCRALGLALLVTAGCASEAETGDRDSSDTPASSSEPDAADAMVPGEEADATWVDTAPGPVPPERVSLGTFPAGLEPVVFDLDEGISSVGIDVVGPVGVWLAIHDLRTPDGSVVALPDWPTDPDVPGRPLLCLACPVRVSAAQGTHAVVLHHSGDPLAAPAAGTWSLRVLAFRLENRSSGSPTVVPIPADVTIQLALKRGPAAPTTGILDLNLHFPTDLSRSADAPVAEAIEAVAEIYEAVGIEIGQVRTFPLDTSPPTVSSVYGAGNDVARLTRAITEVPPGLDVVFVDSITDDSSPLAEAGPIMGISGGIPGPTGDAGTARSAVIVSLADPGNPSVSLGRTIAHEMGHYLGLFHTVENQSGISDNIEDTVGFNAANLMFFAPAAAELTPGQAAVLRAHPRVRN